VARSAVYTRNSFRGRDLEYREIYFEPVGHGYRLMENIRAHVQFQHANLLGPDFHLDRGNYHFIFCRNLLIYFDRPTQDRAVQTLTGLLAPDGVLFVGPAEAGLMVNHGFVSAKLPLAFAFRRATAAAPVQLEPGNARPPRRKSAVAPAATPAPLRSRSPAKPQVSSATRLQPEVDGKPKADLKLAAQLADQGRMDEAARMCADYLRDHQPTAPAFYLLGVLSDAAGDIQEASQYYRKALYLQPDHYEAMMHLAYSTEKLGGVAAARNLRARARRLKERMDHA
jgi:chemotaxis protein methyltransferase WspC